MARTNFFKPDDIVVCIITGHGLKNPDTAISVSSTTAALPADRQAVADYPASVPEARELRTCNQYGLA